LLHFFVHSLFLPVRKALPIKAYLPRSTRQQVGDDVIDGLVITDPFFRRKLEVQFDIVLLIAAAKIAHRISCISPRSLRIAAFAAFLLRQSNPKLMAMVRHAQARLIFILKPTYH
jgi:hypothetical protein